MGARIVARLARTVGFAVAAFVALAVPSLAEAQRIRGVVRDSASRAVIAGAVVTVVDSVGAVRARTIADAAGAFSLPAAGAARLRVVRIGFRPRDLVVAREDASVVVAMLRLPQMLDVVRVAGRATCAGEAGPALDLWQQARDGLLAAIVARDERPADVRLLRIERTLSVAGDTVRSETARWMTGRSARPLRAAREPAEFARTGYVSAAGDGRTFFAPDADVLFDESFAATHCFRVAAADARHPGAIGLAFEPARERRGVVDVRGTLWLDPAGPSLRALEFAFTGVEPEYARAGAGGRLAFATAANGIVLVSRWSLRLPMLGDVADPSTRATLGRDDFERRRRARTLGVVGVSETGGAVATARWPDSTAWRDSLARISGRVARRDGTPVPGAAVALVGTARTAAADDDGRYAFAELLPGTYGVAVVDTSFAGWLEPRGDKVAVTVLADGAAGVADLHVPDAPALVDALCEAQPPSTALLLARLGGAGGGANVTIAASWLADVATQPAGPTATLVARESRYTITPDDDGRFHLCGVARDRPVRLTATRDGLRVGDTTIVLRDASPGVHTLRTVARTTRAATLAGAVVASDGARVANAEIILPELGLATRADSLGAYRFERLPVGHLEVVVRAIGYAPRADSVVVSIGATRRDLVVARTPARLADVEITGANVPLRLREFEERRALGIGDFIDEAFLRANDGRQLSDVLAQRATGLRLVKVDGAEFAASARAGQLGGNGRLAGPDAQGRCYLDVYVDGARLYVGGLPGSEPPDLGRLGVRDYAAVEVYVGIASVPARYARRENMCGVMLLWTRSR